MSNDILRKKNTGEAGNGGEFGAKRHDEADVVLENMEHMAAYTAIVKLLPVSESYWRETERVSRVALNIMFDAGDPRVAALIKQSPDGAVGALESVMYPSHNGDAVDPDLSDLRDTALKYTPESIAKELLEARRLGLSIVLPNSKVWPTGLSDLGDGAPLVLWTKGDLSLVSDVEHNIAIEGARASTGYGEHVTMTISAALSEQRTIVSSGAYGISGMALRSTLAAGQQPVLIAASGHSNLTPAAHTALFARVADVGAVVSEYAPSAAPTKKRFIRRNKVLAAIAGTTVIVEASARSGSLSVAREAKALGRKVGAVPGPVTSAISAGTHLLISEGTAKIITSEADVLSL